MKTKLVLLFTLLGLTACTTSAVKMSPEETQSFFTDNSDLAQAQNEGLNRISAQSCDTKSGPCWKIECIGNNCWKTELAAPPEGLIEKATDKPAEARALCASSSETAVNRRKGCYDYITYLGEQNSQASIRESIRVLNTMCDFSGVSCKKNYNKFGTGKLAVDDSRQHFKSGQLKIYTYVSSGAKTVIVYDYSVLL